MPAAWLLRIVPSIALHAAALLVVMFGGDVLHRAHAVPKEHHLVTDAMMTAWLPPASSSRLERLEPAVQEQRTPVVTPARTIVPAEIMVAPEPVTVARPMPELPKPVLDAAAVPQFAQLALLSPPSSPSTPSPPPSLSQTPSNQNLSILFVGIENGEWLHWLAERHGFVGFTMRRDDVIEHVYSVSGEPLSTSSVAVADLWALELTQPEHVAVLADMLARERARAEDPNDRIRVFALFPASFRDEVAAAIHRAGGTDGVFLVSFSGNELQVAASTAFDAGATADSLTRLVKKGRAA